MSEYAPDHRDGSAMTRVMTGYHVGAVLTALLALWVDRRLGLGGDVRDRRRRRPAGAAGAVVRSCPESDAYLRTLETRRAESPRAPIEVVRPPYLRVSIGLWVASFMGLLLVYGLNTWLPKLMGEAGYSIEAGTTLLLVLNLGAVIGLLFAGRICDARGNKPTVLLVVRPRGDHAWRCCRSS